MRRNKRLEIAFARAEAQHQCLNPRTPSDRKIFYRRTQAGELIRVRRNLYARAAYWESLNYHERIIHILRSITARHPDRIFAGVSAAAIWGLTDNYRLQKRIHLAVAHNKQADNESYVFIAISNPNTQIIGHLKTTGLLRTLYDCARLLAFRDAVAIVDAGLRRVQGMGMHRGGGRIDSKAEALNYFQRLKPSKGHERALFVLGFANAMSENGGESITRAALYEWGYMTPEIQVDFSDPVSGRNYRVDFLWRLSGNRIVIGELDGKGKYLDNAMTNGRNLEEIILREKDRESNLSLSNNVGFVRFSFQQLINEPHIVQRKLDLAGIPRTNIFPIGLFMT